MNRRILRKYDTPVKRFLTFRVPWLYNNFESWYGPYMDPRLGHRLESSQKFILSPQIRQYLELLQLPIADLMQAIQKELETNPILEETADGKNAEVPVNPSTANINSKIENAYREVRPGESERNLKSMEEWNGSFSETDDFRRVNSEEVRDWQKRKDYQETLITRPESLSDYISWQAGLLQMPDKDRAIAAYIIGNINEDGYLTASEDDIAQATKSSTADAFRVISQIQELDPPGIAARNLQEALSLQIIRKMNEIDRLESEKADDRHSLFNLALDIVRNQLPLLEKRDWNTLSRIFVTDIGTIRQAVEIIARLEPKPGRIFYSKDSIAVVPDATVSYEDQDDAAPSKFKIDIHDEIVPEIRINPYYRKLLRSSDSDDKTKIFLREKIENGMNFLKAMQLRKSTLREITEAIVKAQPEFIEKGFSALKPLRLKDIASDLGIHESTVSRAIQGKYMLTPRGMVSYKSFFSNRLGTDSGGDESQKSIMERVRELIRNEDPRKPLSDQDIIAKLKEEGITLARRTAAKYRDLLKILPSHMRRKK